MPTFTLNKVTRIIEVASPDTEVTIQQLINAIRNWEDELVNIETAKIADASGKEDLGGGLQVGITLKLLNWRLKFEDRSGPDWVGCGVTGGNLVAVDANNQPMNPIQPAAYVTVTVAKAVSAAILAAIAEWTQSQKNQIFADISGVDSSLATVGVSLDEAKHHAGIFEPEKESLEAIRTRLDEVYAKPSGGRGFSI